MSTKANNFKIGLFVIGAVAVATVTTVVLVKPQKNDMCIETYIDESVEGLSRGSPFNYMGVKIGEVKEIDFVHNKYNFKIGSPEFKRYGKYVIITISTRQSLLLGEKYTGSAIVGVNKLVNSGMRIHLTSNPLTGLAHLEAYLDDSNAPDTVRIAWTPEHPYIPANKSVLTKFTQSAEAAFDRLQAIDVEGLIDKARTLIDSLNDSIKGMNVEGLSKVATDLVVEMRQTNEKLQVLLDTGEEEKPLVTLADILVRLDSTLGQIDRIVSTQKSDIANIIDDIKEFSANARELSEELKRNPSKILSKPPRSEVVR